MFILIQVKMTRCTSLTMKGKRCNNACVPDTLFCQTRTGDCNMEPATEIVTLEVATPPVIVVQYVEIAVPPTYDNYDIDMKINEH